MSSHELFVSSLLGISNAESECTKKDSEYMRAYWLGRVPGTK